jgi:hypothetical protein
MIAYPYGEPDQLPIILNRELFMSNHAAVNDGQAPARRFGALVFVMIVLCACACALSVWMFFAKDGIKTLQTSFHLQTNGETTAGTVVELEQYEGVRPTSSSSYKLFVEYVVDGETFTVKSNAFYPTKGSGWTGESMPIVYDPQDPGRAQIDTFNERWWMPITSVLP